MNIQIKTFQNNSNISVKQASQTFSQQLDRIDSISFNGLHNDKDKALFVFDLDGTFMNGTNEEIKQVLEIQKRKNCVLAYATGRTLGEFIKKQAKLKESGIILPTPKHLITNNGQFVYENIDGKLVEDLNWRNKIKEKTSFDRDTVYETTLKIAHRPEYMHTKQELKLLNSLDDIEIRKQEDPDFWDSKISYYEWNASAHMVEFFVASDIDIDKLQKTLKSELKNKGIKTKFILNKYDKPIMDACNDRLIRQSRPLREDSAGNMIALFLCPADKADGIKYVKNKLHIPYNEILMAGNESNDISMANLAKKGSFFVCLNNASTALKNAVTNIKAEISNKFPDNLISTQNIGVAGILEGINNVLIANSNE